MSRAYLPEYAENARLALEVAENETSRLAYSHRTLYAHAIDRQWVEALTQRDDLSEKIDAFVGRFGRLQDHIGEKLIPRFAALLSGIVPLGSCRSPYRADFICSLRDDSDPGHLLRK